jgi:site-specific DNA recombinase
MQRKTPERGFLDPPALKRLLVDIEAGKVDCVMGYKVDRLSRSLLDFARIIEQFDRGGMSFVSVTQQFNTTNSLGRLTVNILLSFAQFERKIISERTRNKQSAARKKGKWIGGHPVLGYDCDPRGGRLIVNAGEAPRVRTIFDLYLEHQGALPCDSRNYGCATGAPSGGSRARVTRMAASHSPRIVSTVS